MVSDEVGQVYIFGTGSKMSEKDVKYDQVRLIQTKNITCSMELIGGVHMYGVTTVNSRPTIYSMQIYLFTCHQDFSRSSKKLGYGVFLWFL